MVFPITIDENAIDPLWKGQRFRINTYISSWVMQNHQSAIIDDISSDQRISWAVDKSTFIKSMAMVSICSKERIAVGAIGTD
jgi:two-component system CheB/CheR fusion protein